MKDKALMHRYKKSEDSSGTHAHIIHDEKAEHSTDIINNFISSQPENSRLCSLRYIITFLVGLFAIWRLGFVAHLSPLETSKYEHHQLYTSYSSDFNEALKQRQEAMKKYSFPYSLDGVDKRSDLSLEEFRDVYDAKWPVIITDLVPAWPAFNWTVDFFLEKYSDTRVFVTGIDGSVREGYAVSLRVFLETINIGSEDSWTYLQDELFMLQHPELRAHVLDTIYTEENFFTLFPKNLQPWDCMLLWGSAHSRSYLHIDPYNWTGTNAVISGLKKWKLFPPGQDDHLYESNTMRCGFPLDCKKYNSELDMFGPDGKNKDILQKVTYLEVDQLPGEMLFIPTGWFHQAFNAVPTLAVSGQLMNELNYKAVLEEIFKGGHIERSVLPPDINKFSPKELIDHVMKQAPHHIIQEGARWTKDMLQLLNKGGQT